LNISSGVKQATTTTQPTTTAPVTTTAPTPTETLQTTTAATTTQAAQPTTAQVPSLSGDVQSVVQQLDRAGFKASIAYVPGTQPLGTVVAQTPSGGSSAK